MQKLQKKNAIQASNNGRRKIGPTKVK